MENEKTVSYSEIGDVQYRRNNRAKNISIRISADGGVRVTVPGRCGFHRAERFVMEKSNWIRQKTLKIKRLKEKNLVWKAGDVIALRNRMISVLRGTEKKFRVIETEGGYEILLPAEYDPFEPGHQAAMKELVARIGLKEAKRQLPGILSALSEKHALPYGRLTVRRMRTRWGSCSSKNNISLNSGLIFLPGPLIEYVVLHELVHTIHKDHSPRFWNALEARLPGALESRRALRNSTIIA
jgi:predicted metal-dependent hydrolase